MISLLAASAILAQTQDAWTQRVFGQVSNAVWHLEGSGYVGLISDRGLFLAHNSVLHGDRVMAYQGSSRIELTKVFVDEPTQLCVLSADDWASATSHPFHVAKAAKTGRVIAVTEGGPILGDLADLNKIGYVKPSNRYVPLSEVRIETQSNRLAGAFLFTEKGELAGVLGATLDQGFGFAQNGQNAQNSSLNQQAKRNSFGPAGLTVTYAVGPSVLSRVIKGFLSDDHHPIHPSIGIQFKESGSKEVTIFSVDPDSTAAQAGIRSGDVVLKINDEPITSKYRLAARLFEKNPGDTISLRIKRVDLIIDIPVTVGTLH